MAIEAMQESMRLEHIARGLIHVWRTENLVDQAILAGPN
jgi:hypothetical protein